MYLQRQDIKKLSAQVEDNTVVCVILYNNTNRGCPNKMLTPFYSEFL